MNVYFVGNIVPLTYTCKEAGVLVDAATVTLQVTRPDHVIDGPYAMTRASLGTYTYDYFPPNALLGSLVNGQPFVANVATTSPNSDDRDTFVVIY